MRVREVTRTIKTITVTALFIEVETAEPYNETYTLSDHYKNEKKLLEHLEKLECEKTGKNIKCVAVVDKVAGEKVYKMSEEKFIQLANVE